MSQISNAPKEPDSYRPDNYKWVKILTSDKTPEYYPKFHMTKSTRFNSGLDSLKFEDLDKADNDLITCISDRLRELKLHNN